MERALRLTLDVTRHLGVTAVPLAPPAPDASDARVNSLAFSDDGSTLYAATNDGALTVVDVATGAKTGEFFVRDNGCRLVTATHHPAAVLHAAAAGGDVSYHNLHENKITRVFRRHTARVTSISMNPVTDHFLTVSHDGTFCVWDLRSSAPVGVGALVAAWRAARGARLSTTHTPAAHNLAPSSLPAQARLSGRPCPRGRRARRRPSRRPRWAALTRRAR